jgi:divalent metal cation (Fe/Co/Zn/Cd) transporter
MPGLSTNREILIRHALRWESVTIAWMTVEAAVALASGRVARSVPLVAFGADSVIELFSAGVLIWRLRVELTRGEAFSHRTERTAARLAGALLFALGGYIVVAAAWGLWTRQISDPSLPGLVITGLAIPIMYGLAQRKLRLAKQLGSAALRADAVESLTCGWLSLVVAICLIANMVVGAWWVDPVASVAIVWFVLKEAREAWMGDSCCAHDSM